MSVIPDELQYTSTHSWIKKIADGNLCVGITDFAQIALGDIVFVALPILDQVYTKDQQIAMIESVKTGSDIYAPVDGKVIAINELLVNNPALINSAPYETWIYKIEPLNQKEQLVFLSAADYNKTISN